jgi:hypothetical protein
MRRRLLLVAVVVVVGSIGAGVGATTSPSPAQPELTCSITPGMGCLDDQECAAFGAICDTTSGAGVCVCPTDMGMRGDMGEILDAGPADFTTGGGAGGGGGTGGPNGVPPVVAGNAGPVRNGCSYVPGSAR